MMKMNRIMLITLALFMLVVGTGIVNAEKFNEAPMLAELVKEGKLPPVEERLPTEPVVVVPYESVGQYGGTWRRVGLNPAEIQLRHRLGAEPLVRWSREGTIIPNLAKSWDVLDDGRVYIFYLVEGVKWSDGAPFTADDIMFWFEDVMKNKELNPGFPAWLVSGGEEAKVIKRDDYTVEFQFAEPYALFLNYLAGPDTGVQMFKYPKHYMQNFHPSYVSKEVLDERVKEAGFNSWFQLFMNKTELDNNIELPSVKPFVLRRISSTRVVAERNPYYFKVDTEGNQLPYIDELRLDVVQDTQMAVMKAVSGEIDMQARLMSIYDYPLLMENRERGNYDVYLWDQGKSGTALMMNQTMAGNEGTMEMVRNLEFRTALSLALNRDEINEIVYLGLADPAYKIYPFEELQNDPELLKLYAYDPAEANRILDHLGLDKRDAEGFRVLPDGKPLELTLLIGLGDAINPDVSEIVKAYWERVGVKTALDVVSRELQTIRRESNEFMIHPAFLEFCAGFYDVSYSSLTFVPSRLLTSYGPLWGQWYETGGASGVKPEGDARRIQELFDKVKVTIDPVEQDELSKEMLELWGKNLYAIPTSGAFPIPVIVKNNFKNVTRDASKAYSFNSPSHLHIEQFYIVD